MQQNEILVSPGMLRVFFYQTGIARKMPRGRTKQKPVARR
jgi:hypothetical protein